jgi:hypothetical protein
MSPIEKVEVAWKKLNDLLQKIVDGVNRRTLIQGEGISLSESENGVIIRAQPKVAEDAAPSASSSSTGSSDLTSDELAVLQFLTVTPGPGSGVVLSNGARFEWTAVTVVDPANACAVTTILILSTPH